MLSSPIRLAANRANAARSTGPRTPEGKTASTPGTRLPVSLSHGAYATDETLLAGSATQSSTDESHIPNKNEGTASIGGPDLLASFTSHYNPAGPAETLLVRRIVAATLRIDLLGQAFDALMELGERRALVDHLSDRFARDLPTMQVRDQPNWSAMLRRYDGNPGVPPKWGPDPTDDPALDPDPALCTLAYTLSSPRAALLMRHEATAERRLHAAMRELHRLQADRRKQQKQRNEPIPDHAEATRNKDIPSYASASWKEAIPGLEMHPHATMRNEPTSRAGISFPEIMGSEPTSPEYDEVPPNQLIPASLSDTPSSFAKIKPISLSLPAPNPHPGTARNERNEPIAGGHLPVPAASRSADRPSWDRHSVSSSDLLERLIRDAGRRAGPDERQPATGHHASPRPAGRRKS